MRITGKVVPAWDKESDEGRKEWLAARRQGLGGSDAATCVGINRWNSAFNLWHDKLGHLPDGETSDAAEWGIFLENPIAQKYAKAYRKAIVEWQVIIFSEDHPYMFANIDFWEVEPSEQFPVGKVTTWQSIEEPPGLQRILEVKTSGIASFGSADKWGTDDDPEIPEAYLLQTVHYGIVTGFTEVVFAALLPPRGLVVRVLEWDADLAEALIEAEAGFWHLVETESEPAPDGSEATESALKSLYPRHVPDKKFLGGPAVRDQWQRYQATKEAAKVAEEAARQERSALVAMIGDADTVEVDGVPLFSYRANKDSDVFDKDKFAQDHRELYDAYCSTRPGARVIREIKPKAAKGAKAKAAQK